MIKGLTQSGSMPVLERVLQFTGTRHKVLTHNIANLDTPHFRPTDLDPREFQARMRDALDRRRQQPDPHGGPLTMRDTRSMRFTDEGVELRPSAGFRDENILFHDRNNRDLERIMQDLAENTLTHSTAVELLRSEFQLLRTAISERV